MWRVHTVVVGMTSVEDVVDSALATAHPQLRERCSAEKIVSVFHECGVTYDEVKLDSLLAKCSREIGWTVSQFLNVHGQVTQFLSVPRSGRMPL